MDNNLNIEIIDSKKIKKDNINEVRDFNDKVLKEFDISFIINNKIKRKIVCTNSSIKELIYGHLFSQNYIKNINDVKDFNYDEENRVINVTIDENNLKNIDIMMNNVDIVTTGSIYKESINNSDNNEKNDKVELDNINAIMENSKYLLEMNELFKETGALHAAALAFDYKIKYYEFDIGRHNAVDKVIGKALVNNDDLSKAILHTSGRIPTDMINKALRTGIRVVVTRAAVTYDAIKIARDNNIRLIGFSRGESLNIYS